MVSVKKTGLTFKLILILIAGAGIWLAVLAIRQGLYGEKTKYDKYTEIAGSVETIYMGEKPQVWYWEIYTESPTNKVKDLILGLKLGRRF